MKTSDLKDLVVCTFKLLGKKKRVTGQRITTKPLRTANPPEVMHKELSTGLLTYHKNLIRICFITIFKPSVYLRKQRSTSDVYVERDIMQRSAHDIKKEFSAGQPMFNFSSSKTFSW